MKTTVRFSLLSLSLLHWMPFLHCYIFVELSLELFADTVASFTGTLFCPGSLALCNEGRQNGGGNHKKKKKGLTELLS